MSVKLQKGQRISLSKENQGLSKIMVGLGWDEVKQTVGFFSGLFKAQDIDCDAFALLLKDGKLKSRQDIVFFNHLEHATGAVKHMGDNLTGAGEGDDEQIFIDLDRVPAEYNLSENYNNKTAMLFGEVYRKNGEWKFRAIGEGSGESSITEFAKRFE